MLAVKQILLLCAFIKSSEQLVDSRWIHFKILGCVWWWLSNFMQRSYRICHNLKGKILFGKNLSLLSWNLLLLKFYTRKSNLLATYTDFQMSKTNLPVQQYMHTPDIFLKIFFQKLNNYLLQSIPVLTIGFESDSKSLNNSKNPWSSTKLELISCSFATHTAAVFLT